MIGLLLTSHQYTDKSLWQDALTHLITDPQELLTLLELNPQLREAAHAAARSFPLRVTRSFVARMQKGNPDDPLLRQVLPLHVELDSTPGYETDALQEKTVNPVPGVLHKYHGRVWVMLTGACAIHCRYCFRRHFPYADNQPGKSGWEPIFNYIERDPAIREVILSGGDPLMVNDHTLKLFSDRLEKIAHVNTLRLHTRLPIVLPERITPSLIAWIKQLKLNSVIVVHSNHANEMNDEVKEILLALYEAGVTLFNQAVLLKGVNDEVKALTALSEALFAARVLPYYLHQLDKVQGVAHFEVPLARAQALYAGLMAVLPGYLVPRFVCEVPGASSKTLLSI